MLRDSKGTSETDGATLAMEVAEQIGQATNEGRAYVVVIVQNGAIRCMTNVDRKNLQLGHDLLLKAAARLAELIGN